MARWLTEWVTDFAAGTPGAVPTATLFPEPDVADYLGAAVDGRGAGGEGARAGRRVRPARPAAAPGLGSARRGRRAGRRALRQRPDPRRAHRARRVRRGARRASAAAGGAGPRRACPIIAAPSTCVAPLPETCTWTRRWSAPAFSEPVRAAARRLAGPAGRRRRPGRVRLRLPQHPVPLRRAGAVPWPAGPPQTHGSARSFCVPCCTTRLPDCSSSDHCRWPRRRYSRPGGHLAHRRHRRRRGGGGARSRAGAPAQPIPARAGDGSGRADRPMRHRPMRHRPMRHRRRPPPSGSRPYRGRRREAGPDRAQQAPAESGRAVPPAHDPGQDGPARDDPASGAPDPDVQPTVQTAVPQSGGAARCPGRTTPRRPVGPPPGRASRAHRSAAGERCGARPRRSRRADAHPARRRPWRRRRAGRCGSRAEPARAARGRSVSAAGRGGRRGQGPASSRAGRAPGPRPAVESPAHRTAGRPGHLECPTRAAAADPVARRIRPGRRAGRCRARGRPRGSRR